MNKRFKTNGFILSVATAILIIGPLFFSSAQAETIITANAFVPPHHFMVKGIIKPWIEGVEKASEGRIKVKLPAASLAPPPRQWDMVAKGIADVAIVVNSDVRQRLKLPLIGELPFQTYLASVNSLALWRTQKKFFNQANEYEGMKLLAQFTFAGNLFLSSTKPILSVADFKGWKVTTHAGVQKEIMDILGATVVTAPGPKRFELISKGTVDGVVAGHGVVVSLKLGPYIKNVTEVPGKLNNTTISLVMNQKVWDKLSDQDKKAIESVSYENLIRIYGKVFDAHDKRALAEYDKYGIKLHMASDAFLAELKQKLAYLDEKWMDDAKSRGIDGAAAFEFYRSEAKKLSSGE